VPWTRWCHSGRHDDVTIFLRDIYQTRRACGRVQWGAGYVRAAWTSDIACSHRIRRGTRAISVDIHHTKHAHFPHFIPLLVKVPRMFSL